MAVITASILVLIFFLGLGTYGYDYEYPSYVPVSFFKIMDSVIFYPICALLGLIILLATLLYFFDKVRFVRFHKFMSFIDYTAIGVLALILYGLTHNRYPIQTTLSVFVHIFNFMLIITSIIFGIISLIQLFLMPKYVSKATIRSNMEFKRKIAVERLQELKDMYENHLINEEEYNEKKKQYIKDL